LEFELQEERKSTWTQASKREKDKQRKVREHKEKVRRAYTTRKHCR